MVNGKHYGTSDKLDEPLPKWALFALRRLQHSQFKVTFLGAALKDVILYNDMLEIERTTH